MNKLFGLRASLASAAVLLTTSAAFGQQLFDFTNAVQNGAWSDPSTWSEGLPSESKPAGIDGSFTVTVGDTDTGALANLLDIGTLAGQTGTLNISGGDLTIFDAATGAGNEPNLPSIRVGQVAGSTGIVNMSGGLVTIAGAPGSPTGDGELMVGDNGNATWTQTGGQLDAADEIFIGLQASSTATADISGGSFTAQGRSILVGFDGNGTLNVSGTAAVRANFDLLVGFIEGGVGTVNQSGGTIECNIMFSNSFTGPAGSTAFFNQTGGTFQANFAFVLGQSAGTTTMTHSGGVINVDQDATPQSGEFVVGDGAANSSTYSISGTADVNVRTNFVAGRDGIGVVNMSNGTIDAANMFLGDFDSSTGTFNLSGGTVTLTGNLNVGAAIASNAVNDGPTPRVEPNGSNGAQGQALDANGVLNIVGTGGTLSVGGAMLANPADKSPARNGAGQENSSTLRFTLGSTGISTIDVAGIADLDGAVIDIDDAAGFFTANPAGSLTLIDAASGFGNFYGLTPAELFVGPAGAGKNFTLDPADASAGFSLAVIDGVGAQELLVLTKSAGGQPGDNDGDGDVDGNDFLVWQRGGPNFNQAGLNDIKNNFGAGTSVAVAGAVPEPASIALLAFAAIGLAASRTALKTGGRRASA